MAVQMPLRVTMMLQQQVMMVHVNKLLVPQPVQVLQLQVYLLVILLMIE